MKIDNLREDLPPVLPGFSNPNPIYVGLHTDSNKIVWDGEKTLVPIVPWTKERCDAVDNLCADIGYDATNE